jgi:hypothetical protein
VEQDNISKLFILRFYGEKGNYVTPSFSFAIHAAFHSSFFDFSENIRNFSIFAICDAFLYTRNGLAKHEYYLIKIIEYRIFRRG